VIVPPGGVRVLVASRPVDFRKGMDGLAAIAKETLAQDPFSGTILVFRAKRADRVKLLFWDGTGLLLVSKRSIAPTSSQGLAINLCRDSHHAMMAPIGARTNSIVMLTARFPKRRVRPGAGFAAQNPP
jgi:IS66 Orf2 like protein